jgi:hypothetical protein
MTFEERVTAVGKEGFTPRQARFLVTVLMHAGVCMVRQYCAHARIAHGHNARDFFATLVAQRMATPYTSAHRQARLYHLHHRRLYTAIGEPHSRLRRPMPTGRAVERLMILDAVLDAPDVLWLATARDKRTHFLRVLGTSVPMDWFPHLRFGTPPDVTVRYFPDRLPIGVVEEGRDYIFLYLATRPGPVDFRAYLHRHAELLRALPSWTLRVLVPRHLAEARDAYEAACRQELGSPLRPALLEDLRAWCQARQARDVTTASLLRTDDARFAKASRAFSAPRFQALYRAWRLYGDRVLDAAASPGLADALQSGTGRIQCTVVPRAYLHLFTLVGTA